MSIKQMTPQQLNEMQQQSDIFLLDVREPHEFEYCHIVGSQHVPLNYLPENLTSIPQDQDIVLICHHGVRSQYAANFLSDQGFKTVFNLSGGIDAWARSIDPTMPVY